MVQEAPQPQVVKEGKTTEEENKTQAIVTDLNDPPLSDPESFSERAGGGSVTEPPTDMDLSYKHDAPTVELQTLPPLSDNGTNQEATKPVAPPRRKPAAPHKSSLKLAPLARAQTPVEILEEGGDRGKEEREEEKEKASPAETADEGEGDGETGQREEEKDMTTPVDDSSSFYQSQITLLSSIATEPVKAEDKKTELAEGNTEPPQAEENDSPKPEADPVLTGQDSKTEPAKGEAEPAESAKPEVEPTTGPSQTTPSVPAPVNDPAKVGGGCIIL